jgi:hypothetical protein
MPSSKKGGELGSVALVAVACGDDSWVAVACSDDSWVAVVAVACSDDSCSGPGCGGMQ